jgi:quercetin dioxygenase-like cupin family protein
MGTRRVAAAIVVGAGVVTTALAYGGAAQPADAPVPVHQEPRHHLVYDSPAARVLDIQIPPGDTTLFHTHDTAILYVPIGRSQTRSQVLGAEWSGGAAAPQPAVPDAARPGRVNSVTTYVETPFTHRVNNVGSSLFRLIGIANRTPGSTDGADDVSGLSSQPELVNSWYRVHRVVLKAGEATAPHRHAVPIVVVMQTPGTASSAAAAWRPLNGPGDLATHDGAGEHVVRNAGAADVELVEIELRGKLR